MKIVTSIEQCVECGGLGYQSVNSTVLCDHCKGSGRLVKFNVEGYIPLHSRRIYEDLNDLSLEKQHTIVNTLCGIYKN